MAKDDVMSTLFARVRTDVYSRIQAAAAADSRSVTKWVENHFRLYFEELDRCKTVGSGTSSSDSENLHSDSCCSSSLQSLTSDTSSPEVT